MINTILSNTFHSIRSTYASFGFFAIEWRRRSLMTAFFLVTNANSHLHKYYVLTVTSTMTLGYDYASSKYTVQLTDAYHNEWKNATKDILFVSLNHVFESATPTHALLLPY